MSSSPSSLLVSLGFSLVALTLTASASADPSPKAAPAPSPWIASYGAGDTGTAGTDRTLAGERDAGTSATGASPAASATRIDAIGHLGLVGGKGYAGLMTGATLLGHRGEIGYGGTFEYSAIFSSRLGVAATGGWSRRTGGGLGLDLLGSIGVHHYMRVGHEMLSSDPGVDATLPYAGVRGRVSYLTGSVGTRFQLGVTASYDQDLTKVTKSSTYRDGWLSWDTTGPQTTTTEHTIGYGTVGVMVDAGVHFD